MNTKTNSSSSFLLKNLFFNLYEKLTQSHEFYNIKFYTKNKTRLRNRNISW